MKVARIGDYVETIHGINGILKKAKAGADGLIVFIETESGATIFCPISDLKNCEYYGSGRGFINERITNDDRS